MKPAKFALFLSCVVTLAGCVRETLQECLTTINFSYRGDGGTEIFSEKIDRVDLYIFGDDEWTVEGFERYQLSPAELAAQSVQLQLPTGRRYTAVAVCNMNNGTTLDLNNGNIFDSKVMHPVTNPDIPTGDRRVDSQDHLYGGNEALTIPPTAGSTHTVNLVSGHVEMMVEVVGFEEVYATTRQGSAELELEHRGLPSYTDFSGNVTTNERLSQFPPRRRVVEEEDEDDSIYSHEYQVMRGVRGSTIHLYNGEEEIFTLDVEEYVQEHLMPNPNIPGPYDANGILLNEAYIPIRIEITDPGDDEEDDDDEDDEDDEEEDPGDDDDPEDPDPEDPDEIDVVFTVSIPNWALQDVTPEF